MTAVPLSIEIGGKAGLIGARNELQTWLSEAGADEAARADIVLACWEATANAIEHPRMSNEHVQVQLQAKHRGDHIVMCVSDTGQWREQQGARDERGFGLKLIRALVDRVEIVATERGTQVFMSRSIAPAAS